MAAVLRKEPELRRKLCDLLTPDYTCFGYDVQDCYDGTALQNVSPYTELQVQSVVPDATPYTGLAAGGVSTYAAGGALHWSPLFLPLALAASALCSWRCLRQGRRSDAAARPGRGPRAARVDAASGAPSLTRPLF